MTAHLSEQDIRFYRNRSLAPKDLLRASNHLAQCEECRGRVISAREAQTAVHTVRRGVESEGISSTHLSYEDIEACVDETLVEAEILRVQDHVHRCEQCASETRQINLLKHEVEARTTSTTEDPANRPAHVAQSTPTTTVATGWLRYVSMKAWVPAAVCAVVVFIVWYSLRSNPERVEKQLAQAYTERRTLQMRIPYAAHSEFHQLKSGEDESLLVAPESLERAASEIRSRLKKNPKDPEWLLLGARLDLLDWRYKAALTALDRIGAGVDTPGTRLTRALAMFEKGEMEHDDQAYAEVVDLMGKTLQGTPDDSIALFNQGIACEKLRMYECASRDYEHVIKVEKDSGWVGEAREHLNRIRDKQVSRALKLQEMQDPGKIWMEIEGDNSIGSTQGEAYIEFVLQEWLANPNPTVDMKDRSFKLAQVLEQAHGDTWLTEFLRGKAPPFANRLLRSAIKENHDGSSHQAEDNGASARAAFLDVKNIAGAARSEFEVLYALQRQSRSQECIGELPRMSRLLRGKTYRWLETQELLEVASCKAMSANFDAAWRSASEAANHAKAYGYESLALRALGFESALHTLEGRLSQSWRNNSQGLELFWNGLFPADRGFQFYADLELAAEQASQLYVAVALQREALEMLSGTGRADVTAIAHFRLGVLLGEVGSSRESEIEISESYRLLNAIPASTSTALYKSFCEILLANLEAHSGARLSALGHLNRAKADVASASNFMLRLRYLTAYAETLRREGNRHEEEKVLEEIVSIGKAGYDTLHSDKDRWDWARTAGSAWRRLFELKMQKPHTPADSLALWETYRAYQGARGSSDSDSFSSSTRSNLSVLEELGHLTRDRLIVFAVLQARTIVWVADHSQVLEFNLPIDEVRLRKQIEIFYQLCSDPSSLLEDVKEAGLRLYQSLLAPIQSNLSHDDTLLIEADGILGIVPWSALTTESGEYFGQLHTIVNTTGFFAHVKPRHASIASRTLVAYPGPVELQGEKFLPLPQAEAEADFVAKLSPGTVYLHGNEADADTILRELPNFTVFYFTGHAAERTYGGELVVQGRRGGDVISASRLERLHLFRTQLVVLSACSTAVTPGSTSENPNGLVHAFLRAGANEVLASRWSVDSSRTNTLMNSFYRNFLARPSAAEALHTAQEETRSKASQLHPYYWASFQVFRTL